MRTTLNIEDEAFLLIKKYAEERAISLGQAASDLVHRGAESIPRFKLKNGWVLFELALGSSPITNDHLADFEKTDNEAEHQRAFSPRP